MLEVVARNSSVGDEMLVVKYQRESNIAAEVFMLDHCTSIRYNDLMSSVGSDQISSNSLLAYLDTRAGREGIIALYKREHRSHFDRTGKWQARYIFDFLKYVRDKLTSSKEGGMLRNRQTRTLGLNSLNDPTWMEQMIAVSCLRLLEDLYDTHALMSNSARRAIRTLRMMRDAIDSLAAANNRTAKRMGAITKYDADQNHQRAVEELQKAVRQSLHDIDADERKVLDTFGNFFFEKKTDLLILPEMTVSGQ